MEPDIHPILDRKPAAARHGRLADAVASGIAALAALLSLIVGIVFFAGFVENDNHFAAIVSAFSFTALLAAFAIVPPIIISRIAWRAYRNGGTRRGAAFCLLLSGPWLILSGLCVAYTPLPIWVSGLALLLSALLAIWAIAGIFLEK